MRTQVRTLYGYSWLTAGLVFLLCAPRRSTVPSHSVSSRTCLSSLLTVTFKMGRTTPVSPTTFSPAFHTVPGLECWSVLDRRTDGRTDGQMDSPVFLASRNFQPEYGFSSFCRFCPAVQHGVWGEEYAGGPSVGAWRSLCPGITDSAQRDAGTTRKGS